MQKRSESLVPGLRANATQRFVAATLVGCLVVFSSEAQIPANVNSKPTANAVNAAATSVAAQAGPTTPAPMPAGAPTVVPVQHATRETVVPAPPLEMPIETRQKTGGIDLQSNWTDGLRFTSDDGAFSIHVGGNGQWDSTWLIGRPEVFALPGGGNNGTENDSTTFLRRVRLRFEGAIYERFDYIVEYDMANADNDNSGLQEATFGNINGAPAPINVWMQIRDLPVIGNLRIGHQLKPIGMTNNAYQGFLPFIERPENMDAFYGPFDKGFATGISALGATESERATWRYGAFRPLGNVFGIAINHYLVGARVTGLPVYEEDGRRLVHIGLGSTYGDLISEVLRVRGRPMLRNGPGYAVPVLVDTGEIPGSRQCIVAPEIAAVYGPWTFQAEWTGQWLTDAVTANGTPLGTVFYHGGYFEALYFLTGEFQEYDKKSGAFGRVTPRNNFSIRKGHSGGYCGAWQIGGRFSYLNLNDKSIQGGTIQSWTAGLNWFLNPNMKIQFNYVLEHRDQPGVTPGWINGLGVRAAYDF